MKKINYEKKMQTYKKNGAPAARMLGGKIFNFCKYNQKL